MKIFYDLETKSHADLKTGGAWRYSEHPTTDVICMAYAIDNNPVKVWIPGQPVPKEFKQAEFFIARNVLFEYAMTYNVLIPKYGFPVEMKNVRRYICTAALSRMHGLPASLEPCADYLNKVHKKLPDGARLIRLYSIPVTNKKTGEKSFRSIPPDDMKKWVEYNKIDVEADRETYGVLSKLPNFEIEKEIFWHDLEMNVRGIKIDTPALNKLLNVIEETTERVIAGVKSYTVEWVDKEGNRKKAALNARSPQKLKIWLADNGIEIEDCRIDTIEEAYEEATNRKLIDVQKVLAWRLFLAKASVKKFRAAANRVSPDGRLRYFIKYFGAHTGRFSGEGFQIHNLPKAKWPDGASPVKEIERMIKEISLNTPLVEMIEQSKKIIPGLIIPEKGNVFLAGDFAAIEARGIAWLAGCNTLLRQFAAGTDIYMEMAKKINRAKPNRQLGKAVILGCGYGMGEDKFYQTCLKWGIAVSEQLAGQAVRTYRTTYPEIPRFWYALEEAFRTTWLSKQPHNVGVIRFERGGNYIRVQLPSGRWLYYHQVRVEEKGLSYINFGKKGARIKIWGGVLAENDTQAMCRDILTDRTIELEKQDLSVALTVHDEIVCPVDTKKVKVQQKVFDKILNTAPSWAQGFPLKTESEITKRYHK